MTTEAHRVVDISLKKIVAWRKRANGGPDDLHRTLLLASVLLKAHSVSALANLDGDDHHMSLSSSSSSSSPTTTTDDAELDDEDVVVTLDDASILVSCSRNPEVQDSDPEGSWDAIPDQALDEWTTSTTYAERNATTAKMDGESEKDKRRDSAEDASHSLSRKHRLEMDDDAESEVASKRQRTDCDALCLDFDDLITSMEDEFRVSTIDQLHSSKSFDDSLLESVELEQSTGDFCKNYFETLDCSTDFLLSC